MLAIYDIALTVWHTGGELNIATGQSPPVHGYIQIISTIEK